MRPLPFLALSVLLLLSAKAGAADCALSGAAAEGEAVAQNSCQGCHVFDADQRSKPTAPNLATVYGRPAGSLDDFRRYSQGMKLLADSGLVWDADSLDAYISGPRQFIEEQTGHRGITVGMNTFLPDATKRSQIIAYLQALGNCN